jgi:hypothetical protein
MNLRSKSSRRSHVLWSFINNMYGYETVLSLYSLSCFPILLFYFCVFFFTIISTTTNTTIFLFSYNFHFNPLSSLFSVTFCLPRSFTYIIISQPSFAISFVFCASPYLMLPLILPLPLFIVLTPTLVRGERGKLKQHRSRIDTSIRSIWICHSSNKRLPTVPCSLPPSPSPCVPNEITNPACLLPVAGTRALGN